MPKKEETKHQAFLRLMQKRLGRVLDEFRLIRQLSSSNYESHPHEHLEVVQHLDQAVHSVAQTFGVTYTSTVGEAPKEVSAMTQERIAEALDLLDNMRIPQAMEILRNAQSDPDKPVL